MKRIKHPEQRTATHEEIIQGFKVATKIAVMIRKVPNPLIRGMIKSLVALISII